MNGNAIKYKITLWYTGIITVVLLLVFACVLLFAGHFYVKEAKLELRDEHLDFFKEIEKTGDITSVLQWAQYYDDGVVLSVYNENKHLIWGFYPDDFPIETPFEDKSLREIHKDGAYWILTDRTAEIGGRQYYIRAIYDLTLLSGMRGKLVYFMFIVIPFLALFTGFLGYRMIRRALQPIYAITKMANDITHSSDLSLRLPATESKDELSYLTETFNYMLHHLEDIFNRESQFTSDAAHELRTPISVIISHCEYCLEELKLDGEMKEELQIINKKAHAMSKLVSQLLMIARAESNTYYPEFEETDLALLIETVLEELKAKAAERNISLKLICEPEPQMLLCDFNLMMQLLLNLIQNAINYGRDGGTVEVTLKKENEHYQIHVRDDGIGIPEDCLDKIWGRFFRVDASHSKKEGSGLGLFMVKWIAELHGGSAKVKSMTDLGSIFTVSLPVREAERE